MPLDLVAQDTPATAEEGPRLPWMKFWVADLLTSSFVMSLSEIDFSRYVRLLFRAWEADTPCFLPNDVKILARFAGASSLKSFKATWAVIGIKFTPTLDGKFVFNPKERLTFQKQIKLISNSIKNGSKRHKHLNNQQTGGDLGKPSDPPKPPPTDIPTFARGLQDYQDLKEKQEQKQKPIATKNPSRKEDDFSPKYHQFADLLQRYWRQANPDNPEMPWGKKDIAQLKEFLAVCPNLSPEQFWELLMNRADSIVPQGQRVYIWLTNVTKYSEPLDRFGVPIHPGGRTNAAVPTSKAEGNLAVLAESLGFRKHQSPLDQDGDLPTGEDGQAEPRTIRGDFEPVGGPPGLPSGDGDAVGESKRAGGDGAPIPW